MAKGDVLVRMKADVSNYDANIAKARRTLEGFKQDNLTFGGVLNQSTKSIVAAAAQYASFAAVLGTVASGFAEAVSRGTEMAREMEGVKMAFDRLNQPGLLDNLREATHNTVNDLELMKQAVKFDNFNLSIEQMGTFLAFAQQQAKDTGQDVNYLVDSIVTGLGRKSLPILDNLGLSAEEIRNRMKETGDMTTAVAEIIQERMEAAGGYVETAADRAAQAQVRLDNAMTELGNTMNSLSGAGATLWTDLKIGAIDLANTAIKPLIKLFNELANYINGTSTEDILTRGMTDVTDTVDDNGRLIRKNAINKIPEITVTGNAPKVKPRIGGSSTEKVPEYADFSKLLFKNGSQDLHAESPFMSVFSMMKGRSEFDPENILGSKDAWEEYKNTITGTVGSVKESFDNLTEWTTDFDPFQEKMDDLTKTAKQNQMVMSLAGQAVNSFSAALAGMEDPGVKAAGIVMQSLASIALGFAQAAASPLVTGTGWGWLAFVAAGLGAMATAISTVHSLTGYAQGGIVEGNSYSGDNMMFGGDGLYGLNAGELVLTKSQQNSLAQQLSGNGMGNINVSGRICGTDILLSADRAAQASGRGQLVTWK